ncbi:pssA: CDP-diacylglycerol-serine O-phosphatidyltransferase [Rubrobacter radiotolerans]|uniref:CDP-diacylglycerol--serine O-phosphatidyltransferase n=1 Tax=Rubrobacter radiotolerans TaxID=42256 RepID=A0A023WZQ5_RUBRA|nr:CDP-diacylglycerol--serine O-phosphatidyltransferase [Rubrobacter radiotolerans]AHY45436.1 pssA: CDP-diacylglycerol-serine O-phosphatidyltransferase [Rubrobacter radiotolerans]MDX5892847.1 CDP-diacylglycerol--serine O-phosphatidyltransferase [Rubrobacter radiotolerans]SMC02618.1 CDP-diacylglycerol---serine O-phosphatidyltransferase [Rubrobacter radiotolerans DSM 5868]
MRELFSLPNLATFGNLAAGFSALVLASQESFVRAAVLVGIAAVFDLLDGVIARQSEGESEFGANLDSLADIVSFGVAPAFALFLASLVEFGSLGVAVAAVFVLAGTVRLARFPLVKDRRVFVGLPIPPAGLALAALAALAPPPTVAVATALALGVLMVSVIPFPTLRSLFERSGSRSKERPE